MKELSELLEGHPDFVVRDGIPRFRTGVSRDQEQTSDAFDFKWRRRGSYESEAMREASRLWLEQRYQLPDGTSVRDYVRGKRILDAGCGSGHSALNLFGDMLNESEYIGVDVSPAVEVARDRFAENGIRGQFLQAPIERLPEALGQFDVVFSEGVLHHTDSTRQAVRTLSSRLKAGSLFMFYVYRKKAPVREFADDYVRGELSELSNEDAWETLLPLSELGKALGELQVTVDVPRPIKLLQIPAGKIDVQRLFYWYFCKAFYRADWSLEEMNHINFDWYRPRNCHRHTVDEVREWLEENELVVEKLAAEEAGITVIARRI